MAKTWLRSLMLGGSVAIGLAACSPDPAIRFTPVEDTVAKGETYTAFSIIPAWTLDLDGEILSFSYSNPKDDDDFIELTERGYSSEAVGGVRRYQTPNVTADIVEEVCPSGPNGEVWANRVTVLFDGDSLEGCGGRELPKDPAQIAYDTDGVYKAQGVEPFWSLEMDGEHIRYENLDGTEWSSGSFMTHPALNGWHYQGTRDDGESFTVTVTFATCNPGMGDDYFSDEVTVGFDGKTLRGCGGETVVQDLANSRWQILTIDGQEPARPDSAYVSFGKSSIGGSVGCNSMGGDAVRGEDWIYAPMMISTQMYCGGTVGEQETVVAGILSGRSTYSPHEGGEVLLGDGHHEVALIPASCDDCDAATPMPAGSIEIAWSMQMIDETRLKEDSPRPFQLKLEDGRYTASAGCNQMNGTYTLSGKTLTLSSPMMTKMACPGAPGNYERRFLDIIAKPLTFVVTPNDQLLMGNAVGGLMYDHMGGSRASKM